MSNMGPLRLFRWKLCDVLTSHLAKLMAKDAAASSTVDPFHSSWLAAEGFF